MNVKLAIALTLMLMVVIFLLQNTAVVEFRLLFWTIAMSRSLMLFLLLGIGIILGWLLHGYRFGKKRR